MALRRYGSCFGLGLDEQRRSNNFLKNGAELFEELITSCDGRCNPIRMFSEKDIAKATNNYAVELDIRQYRFYEARLYKGTHEGRAIAVLLYKGDFDRKILSSVIHEVGVLSRINHRNVVKLVGCCLETNIPMLVYEDLSSWEALSHRIQGAAARARGCLRLPHPHLSWENRLNIAIETAYGLTYLHIGTASPIIHRDIKSMNILLGEGCTTVKIIGFDLSVSMPKDQTQIECELAGTSTYIDPLYVKENLLSENSDVYSFGVVLFEILTGKKPNAESEPFFSSPMLPRFLESTEEQQLVFFIDTTVLKKAKKEQVTACIQLIVRCLAETWEERPDMKQVHQELSRIKRMSDNPKA